MTNQLEALISSEIADFFAGVVEIHTALGGPNTIEEAQQQLTERVTRIASECEAALIAALEQSHTEREEFRHRLKLERAICSDNDSEIAKLRARIAELEAENLTSSNALLDAGKRIAELEGAIIDHSNSVHFCEVCGKDDPCATDDVCSVIRAAGGTVQGDE